ncbi:MAG: RNA pseudouridine synthase [Bryobacteraceae bacterium]
MPRTDWGWLITPEELRSWTILEDDGILVVNKPAHVLCHRAKHGAWSSLIAACRDLTAIDRLHMPSRLDRETSGVVLFTKTRAALDAVNRAARRTGAIAKTYHAILTGSLQAPVAVDQPIGMAQNSIVAIRRAVTPEGRPARTEFVPIASVAGHTLVRVTPVTGRTHQIRVHAQWLGHPVLGDKIYGPDERLFVEFLQTGWTPRLREILTLERHALHCSEFRLEDRRFSAPLPLELSAMLSQTPDLARLTGSHETNPPD